MLFLCQVFEPSTFEESKGKLESEAAMKVKYDAQMKNKTWLLSTLPLGKKAIGCEWIFKVKYKSHGSLDKYKSCLVAKGYAQDEGVDCEETFSPNEKW